MRHPLQSGIPWDTSPLNTGPPPIDAQLDDYHVDACLNQRGFPWAYRLDGRTVWVYPEQRR